MKNITKKLATLLVLVVSSCISNEPESYENINEMTRAARDKVELITPEDVKLILESGKKFYLIDCRETEEFNVACIKGAMSVPRTVLEDEISTLAPGKRMPLLLYCQNGDRSVLAAQVLPYLKYRDVKVIEGGFDTWQNKFPELVEFNPVRGAVKKTVAAPSGGCGG